MSFTDDHLKQLKEELIEELEALLARLEAAEVCAEQLYWHNEKLGCVTDGSSLEKYNKRAIQALEAWRKSKGE